MKRPNHVAINLEHIPKTYMAREGKEAAEVYEQLPDIVEMIVKTQVELNIPIVTLFVMRKGTASSDIGPLLDGLVELFSRMNRSDEYYQTK